MTNNNYGYTNSGLQLPPFAIAIISAGTVENPTRVDYYGIEYSTPNADLGASELLTKADIELAGGYLIASLHIVNGGLQTRLVWSQR